MIALDVPLAWTPGEQTEVPVTIVYAIITGSGLVVVLGTGLVAWWLNRRARRREAGLLRVPKPRRARRVRVAGCELEIRGHAVLVDGDVRMLAPASMTALGALASRPGAVVSRAALATALPGGTDGHSVDVAVARLRAALGSGRFIETVVKRGYRLRVDS
ncbi:hypothetical protein GCM10009558_091270 [Virgisporangium aurantiacum]